MYGFDSHDVTRNIVIEHNHISYNGDHGIICSQACGHLTIEYNVSDHNGWSPGAARLLDAEETSQVHGIMLHRGVTNSVVEYNIRRGSAQRGGSRRVRQRRRHRRQQYAH